MHDYIIAYLIGFFMSMGIAFNDISHGVINFKWTKKAVVWVLLMSLLSWIVVGEILYKTSKK